MLKFAEYIREYVGDLYSPNPGTLFDTPTIPNLQLNPNFKVKPQELFDFVEYVADEFGEELLSIEQDNKFVDPFIGSGSYGAVFLLENGRVLKITSDRSEIKVVSKLVKRTTQYLLNYYDVAELYNGDMSLELFAMVMDEVKSIDNLPGRRIWVYAYEFFKFLPNKISKRIIPNLKEEFIRNAGLNYDLFLPMLNRHWDNMVNMTLELRKLKIHRPDLDNILNFGVREDGTVVHIDIRDIAGRDKSLPDQGINLPKIKKIDVSPIIEELRIRQKERISKY